MTILQKTSHRFCLNGRTICTISTVLALVGFQTAYATPGTPTDDEPGPQQHSERLAAPTTETPDAGGPAPSDQENALLKALRGMATEPSDLEGIRVFFAFEDLNNDGVHEAVVHVTSPDYCGTGGCTTMVYQWDSKAAGYAKVNHTPTTRPPIYSSEREGCQWSMLWVQRSGGGRTADLHSPTPLSDVDSCDTPIGPWNEAGSKLLIPAYNSLAEGTAL